MLKDRHLFLICALSIMMLQGISFALLLSAINKIPDKQVMNTQTEKYVFEEKAQQMVTDHIATLSVKDKYNLLLRHCAIRENQLFFNGRLQPVISEIAKGTKILLTNTAPESGESASDYYLRYKDKGLKVYSRKQAVSLLLKQIRENKQTRLELYTKWKVHDSVLKSITTGRVKNRTLLGILSNHTGNNLVCITP